MGFSLSTGCARRDLEASKWNWKKERVKGGEESGEGRGEMPEFVNRLRRFQMPSFATPQQISSYGRRAPRINHPPLRCNGNNRTVTKAVKMWENGSSGLGSTFIWWKILGTRSRSTGILKSYLVLKVMLIWRGEEGNADFRVVCTPRKSNKTSHKKEIILNI